MARHLWKTLQFTYFLRSCFFLLFCAAKKANKIKLNITKEKEKNSCESYIFHSFDELLCSPIGFYEPNESYLSGSTFLLHQWGPSKPQYFFFSLTFVTGWNQLLGACSDLDLNSNIGSKSHTNKELNNLSFYLHTMKIFQWKQLNSSPKSKSTWLKL